MVIVRKNNENGGILLILGLSRENVNRMMASQPVRVSRASHGEIVPEGLTIGLVFGETEQAIQQELIEAGLVKEITRVQPDSPWATPPTEGNREEG